MQINQGDIYWLHAEAPGAIDTSDDHTAIPHPYVVIQPNEINHSRVGTVVVCALTSNLNRRSEPGNLLLEAGEANLPRQSVVVVSQVEAVAKTELGEYIGSLSQERVEQIFAGMRFQQRSFFTR